MLKPVVIITCGTVVTGQCSKCLLFLIMINGLVQHLCVLLMDCRTRDGVLLWNTATVLWAIWVYTCLMLCDGCWVLAGQKLFHQPVAFMLIKRVRATSAIHKRHSFLLMILIAPGNTDHGALHQTLNIPGLLNYMAIKAH